MAKITLPTNYRDDILNSSAEGKRKYVMSYNQDGTVSFEDVTAYDQVGSDFGAGDINTANEAINQSFDKNKLIADLDTINALTEEGYAPDALTVRQINESLVAEDNLKFRFSTDGEGRYGYLGADDSFIPFSVGGVNIKFKYGGKLTASTNNSLSTINFPDKCSIVLAFSASGTSGVAILCWYDINSGKAYRIPNSDTYITEYEVGTRESSMSFFNNTETSIQIKHYSTLPITWLYLESTEKGGGSEVIIIVEPLVPVLTSKKGSDGGEAFASTELDGAAYPAWKVFSGKTTDYWATASGDKDKHVGYKFTTPVCVKKFSVKNRSDAANGEVKTIQLQASNDGASWDNIGYTFTNREGQNVETYFEVSNNNYYLYYRLYIYDTYSGGAVITKLQFYGIKELV